MSEKRSAPNPSAGEGKRPNSLLKEALAAQARAARKSLLVRNREECLPLSRLRQFAQRSAYVPPPTTGEVNHMKLCRSACAATTRAMQSTLGTLPKVIFDRKVAAIRENRRKGSLWFTSAEKFARDLFSQMHDQDAEPERAHTDLWAASHELARALRHCRCAGNREDLEILLSSTAAAISAAAGDPLAFWSWDFDSSWPILQLLLEGAAELHDGTASETALFADAYVSVIRDVPVPLKAMLTYGAVQMLQRGPQLPAMMIAERIGAGDDAIAKDVLAAHYRPNIPRIDGDLEELRGLLYSDPPRQAIANAVRRSIFDHVEPMLAPGEDAETDHSVDGALLLIALQHLLRETMKVLRRESSGLADFVLDDVLGLVVRRALRQHGRTFLALELVATASPFPAPLRVMANALEESDPARQVLFTYFAESLAHAVNENTTLRFIGEHADWIFEGGATHPLGIFGDRAAKLARRDPEVARLIEWTRGRLEGIEHCSIDVEPAEA